MRNRFFSFLFFFCTQGTLFFLFVGCDKKDAPPPPPTISDDVVLKMMDKEIAMFEEELVKMRARQDDAKRALESNAFRPKILEMNRREFFRYDKFSRQIEQEISYLKIRRALRERDIIPRLEKLTIEDLKKQGEEYEISQKALNRQFVWRNLPLPEPSKPNEANKEETPAETEAP